MSKISEYLALIPKGIPNALDIVKAIKVNSQMEHGSLPKDKLNEIVRRRIICASCPFNSENAKVSDEYESLIGANYKTTRNDVHCAFCGCPVNIRTAALNKDCGMSSWNEDHPDQKLTLKWDKYEK